jgi:hypothetical protein
MTTTELSARVTMGTAVVLTVLAAAAGWLAGAAASVGVLAAGALTIGNFLWLARSASVRGDGAARARAGAWALMAGVRFTVLAGVLAGLLASGWAHPVAVVAGLAVLPSIVVVAGLAGVAASKEPS